MPDNIEKTRAAARARAAKSKPGRQPKEIELNPFTRIITDQEFVHLDSWENLKWIRKASINLEKAMALRNLLSAWGNEKRYRDRNSLNSEISSK